jgi:hypothetical protein
LIYCLVKLVIKSLVDQGALGTLYIILNGVARASMAGGSTSVSVANSTTEAALTFASFALALVGSVIN